MTVGRDLLASVDVQPSLYPKAQTTTGTGSTVNLAGYDSGGVVIAYGTWTDGTHTPSVQHSDDSTTYTDAGTDSALLFYGTQTSITALSGTAGGTAVQRIGFNSNIKQYVRVLNTVVAGTTGALIAASIVRGHPNLAPLA